MLTERGELHVRKGRIFIDWLPPIGVSPISDGGKVRPHNELFSNSLKNELQREGKRLESVESFRGRSFLSLIRSVPHISGQWTLDT